MEPKSKQDRINFLTQRSILKVLDARVVSAISQLFSVQSCGPGHIVFEQGADSDAFFIIWKGSVEVIQNNQVVAYLTEGDCFGEIGLLQGSKRNATIRVPEEAELLVLPRKDFIELQTYFKEVSEELTKLINTREAGKLPFQGPGLQGNLAFFDLPTVIQTVVTSRQSGTLILRGQNGTVVAKLTIYQGRLIHAIYGHLGSEPAFYELLARNEPLDFVFEPSQSADSKVQQDRNLALREPQMLILEGARRADELPGLMQKLGWPNGILEQAGPTPDWTKFQADSLAIARNLWLLFEAELTVQQLTEKLHFDRYSVLSTLDKLIEYGYTKLRKEQVGQAPSASQIATVLSAMNAISSNMANLLGRDRIRQILQQSLEESTRKYSNLQSLKVNPETVTLDVRSAAPDISSSATILKSLEYLTLTFLQMAVEGHKVSSR